MWFKRLLSGIGLSRPPPPETRADAAARGGSGKLKPQTWRPGYLDPGSFVVAVQRLLAQGHALHPRLHIFSLADFRAAAGSKWERIAAMVASVSETIIRRHLNPRTDIFTRIDAETSLLAMPLASRSEARTCVAAIARDLATQLFGDAVVGGRRLQVVAANMPMSAAVTEEGRVDMRAVRLAVAPVKPVLAPEQVGPPRLTDLHRSALAELVPPDEAASLGLLSGGEPVRGGDAAPAWSELHVGHHAQQPEARRPLLPTTRLTLVWRPTWLASRRGVGAYAARVIRVDAETATPLEGAEAYAGTSSMGALTMDRFVATTAMRELRELSLGRGGERMIVPVFWSSLASPWHSCLTAPLADSPAAARRRRLKLEIIGVQPSAPPGSEMQDLAGALGGLECDLYLRLPLDHPEIGGGLDGFTALGVDLAELPEERRCGDDDLFARLEAFRRAVGRPCYVWGVRRRPLIARLARSGFVMINGPGLAPDLAHPCGATFNATAGDAEK